MKTNIKLRVTPEQSEAVQKICFANGVFFIGANDKISYTEAEYLFIEPAKIWYREIADHDSGIETEGYTEVDADLFIRTNGTCEEPIDIVDNSSNNKSKEDMFKQYGFEVPDFDCELLGSISAPNNQKLIVGVIRKSVLNISSYLWRLDGTCFNCSVSPDFYEYNLTPIKQPWYETCKYPVLVWDIFTNKLEVATEYNNDALYLLSNIRDVSEVRPLSNDEIDQLKQDF